MNDSIEIKYALLKQAGTIECIETRYGTIHLEDDEELKAAIEATVRRVLDKRLAALDAAHD